ECSSVATFEFGVRRSSPLWMEDYGPSTSKSKAAMYAALQIHLLWQTHFDFHIGSQRFLGIGNADQNRNATGLVGGLADIRDRPPPMPVRISWQIYLPLLVQTQLVRLPRRQVQAYINLAQVENVAPGGSAGPGNHADIHIQTRDHACNRRLHGVMF